VHDTCCKGKQSSMRDEREGYVRGELSKYFPFLDLILKMKYLNNSLSKLRTIFTFEILTSRSSKLDSILICFINIFFGVLTKLPMLYFGVLDFQNRCT
jgi:hypothetical protein